MSAPGHSSTRPEPGLYASTRRVRTAAAVALVVLLALVAGLQASHVANNPFPKATNHETAQLIPKMLKVMEGYDSWPPGPDEHERMITNVSFYPLPERVQEPLALPLGLPGALMKGGRLHWLVGSCSQRFSACWPHSMALPALVAHAVPGHPLLVNLVPTFWLLLLLAALFGVGRELGGAWVGLGAAMIGAGYPGLFGHARFMEGYTPAAALSVAMVWCLLRSKGLSRPLPLLGFAAMAWTALRTGEGFSEGLGVGLAVSGPFSVELFGGLWAGWKRRAFPWRTLGGAGGVLLLVWLTADTFWIRGSMLHVNSGFSDTAVAAWVRPDAPWPWLHPLVPKITYPLLIWNDYLLPLMVVWLVAGLVPFLLRQPRHRVLTVLWFAVPLVAYSLQIRKSMWYPMPVLPPLAVITAVGLAALPRRRLRGIALALAAFTGLAQLCFLSTQWGHRVVPEENWLRSPLPEGLLNLRGYDLASLGDPALQGLHGHAEKLLALAEREIPRSERLKYIAVLSPWGQMTEPADALAYLLPLERSDLVVIPLANMSYAAQAGFDGLEPSDFAYLLQLDGTRVVPCCHVQVSTQDAQDPNLVPVREFLDRLNEVSAGAVEDWPELVRLPAATR